MKYEDIISSPFDFLLIGSAGFYQVGSGTKKHQVIEKSVINALFENDPMVEIPSEFTNFCKRTWISFPYEQFRYEELALTYKVSRYEKLREKDPKKFDRLHKFVAKCQSYLDSQTYRIVQMCKLLYGEKLQVVYRSDTKEVYQEMQTLKLKTS